MTPLTELDRLIAASLAATPKPEEPMPYDTPDLGHPLQDHDEPKPLDFVMTPAERDRAKLVSLDLERQRREANKRDEDRDIAGLGVVFTDGDAA